MLICSRYSAKRAEILHIIVDSGQYAAYIVDRIYYPQEGCHMPHIHVDRKNGAEYHTLVESKRVDGKKVDVPILYLGRLIDREKGIYRNREKGTFVYNSEEGAIEPAQPIAKEKLILDFGDSYILDELLARTGFRDIMARVFPSETDTVILDFHGT